MEIFNSTLKGYTRFSIKEVVIFALWGLLLFYLSTQPGFTRELSRFFPRQELKDFPSNIFFVLVWFFSYLFFKKMGISIGKYLFSFRRYNFNSKNWPKGWEYQGNVRPWDEENTLYITDSNSGCLLRRHFWKNLEMNFQFKFLNGGDNPILGIILRAKNLSDYLMVQINCPDNKIIPHVRIDGIWETIDGPWEVIPLYRRLYRAMIFTVLL